MRLSWVTALVLRIYLHDMVSATRSLPDFAVRWWLPSTRRLPIGARRSRPMTKWPSSRRSAAVARSAASQLIQDLIELVRQPIRVAEIVAVLKAPGDGAVLAFEGIVRDHSGARRTLYLDYEAYESMALVKLRELAGSMRERFPIDRVALVHRLGRLEIGETSVLVAVSSEHRGASFDACRFGIDTLKRTVPIWKKEYFEGGAVWADGEMPPVPSNSGLPESKP